ncbi:hypothetical protein AD936_00975, partial [Gluconobacter japonicus]
VLPPARFRNKAPDRVIFQTLFNTDHENMNGMTPNILNQALTHRRLHLRLSPTNTSENRNARLKAGRFLVRMLSTPSQEN